MDQAMWVISYKLKEEVSVEAFIAATQKMRDEYISKQEGYISWHQEQNQDLWTDRVIWDSFELAEIALRVRGGNAIANAFYSKMDINTCKARIVSVNQKEL